MRPGRLTVAQVARRMGQDRRTVLRLLWAMHAEHGGLMERARGRRTKLWIVEPRLAQLMPEYRSPNPRNIAVLHNRVDRAETLAERALQRVGRLESRVGE